MCLLSDAGISGFQDTRISGAACVRAQVADEQVQGGYTAAEFHPDGLILGTGTADAFVRIWEARQQKVRGGMYVIQKSEGIEFVGC